MDVSHLFLLRVALHRLLLRVTLHGLLLHGLLHHTGLLHHAGLLLLHHARLRLRIGHRLLVVVVDRDTLDRLAIGSGLSVGGHLLLLRLNRLLLLTVEGSLVVSVVHNVGIFLLLTIDRGTGEGNTAAATLADAHDGLNNGEGRDQTSLILVRVAIKLPIVVTLVFDWGSVPAAADTERIVACRDSDADSRAVTTAGEDPVQNRSCATWVEVEATKRQHEVVHGHDDHDTAVVVPDEGPVRAGFEAFQVGVG